MAALQAKIKRIYMRTHSNSDKGLSWPIGFPPPLKPRTQFEVLQWVYFTSEAIFHTSEHFTNKTFDMNVSRAGVDQLDVADAVRNSEEFLGSQKRGKFKFLYGYRRFDAGRGMEYMLDFGSGSEIIR
jgi:hypothetical protein